MTSDLGPEYVEGERPALASVRGRIQMCRQDGLIETMRFLRQLESALIGEHPLDQVGIVAAMAASMEQLERRLVALERA